MQNMDHVQSVNFHPITKLFMIPTFQVHITGGRHLVKTKVESKDSDIFTLNDIPGFGPVTIQNLNKFGIETKVDIYTRGWVDVMNITGLDRTKMVPVMSFCREALIAKRRLGKKEQTAAQVLKEREKIKKLTTGSSAFDKILGGGFESKSITEISGPSESGKSTICFNLACFAPRLIKDGGLTTDPKRPATTIFIDTEKRFRPERIKQILLNRGLANEQNYEKIMESTIVKIDVHDSGQMLTTFEMLNSLIEEINCKLLIVDSGTSLFRQEMSEMGIMGVRSRYLNRMMRSLTNLCDVHDMVIIFVNQVYASPDLYTFSLIQYGGHVVGHAVTYRVTLKKKSKVWVATAKDFPHLPPDDAEFLITNKGIEDVVKK